MRRDEKSFPAFPAFTPGKGIYFPAFPANFSKKPIIPAFPAIPSFPAPCALWRAKVHKVEKKRFKTRQFLIFKIFSLIATDRNILLTWNLVQLYFVML